MEKEPGTEAGMAGKVIGWLWTNRQSIAKAWSQLRAWLPSNRAGPVVILGPGGTGKDTLAKVLTSKEIPISLDLSGYNESDDISHYTAKRQGSSDIEIIVLPGQKHRRETTWPEFLNKVSAGKIRGVIFLTSYGYHSIGNINIRSLQQWKGRKDRFLKAYVHDRVAEELNVLSELTGAIKASNNKMWLLSATTKQDLWWQSADEVKAHYLHGPFREKLDELMESKDPQHVRCEQVFCSLTISDFVTGMGEVLQQNAAGYGLKMHAESLKRLIESLDSLRRWEER